MLSGLYHPAFKVIKPTPCGSYTYNEFVSFHFSTRPMTVKESVGPACKSPAKTRYPLYRRPGGPQGRSGRVWKISPQPGFDLRIVQPVTSHYADYALPAHNNDNNNNNNNNGQFLFVFTTARKEW